MENVNRNITTESKNTEEKKKKEGNFHPKLKGHRPNPVISYEIECQK